MVYVKMVNESPRRTTSSSEHLLFFNYYYYIASIEYRGGSVVERGPGNEQSLLVVWWLFGVNSPVVMQCVPQFLLQIFANDVFSFFSVCNKWIHEYGQEFRRRCGKTPEEE